MFAPEDFAPTPCETAAKRQLPDVQQEDARFMAIALRLAERGLGRVAPNPAVGCLLVKNGTIIARGWTQPGGRPHAEAVALAQAGPAARGATCYVTLEPCAHHGRTPPCADALVAAGIQRVVVAMTDPDPRTAGRGIARLQEAGLMVTTGVGEPQAQTINRGFLLRMRERRPFVALKLATSIDGRIATRTGHACWITGERARAYAHLLRARHDAILIGGRTQRSDDPLLTCRLPGLEAASPIRIVLTRSPHLDPDSRLMRTADNWPVWLLLPEGDTAGLAAPDPEEPSRPGLYALTFQTEEAEDASGTVSSILRVLATAGITRLLVEGGGMVTGLFLRARLFDRLYHFTGNCLIGADGVAATASLAVADVARDAPRLRLLASRSLEETVLSVYEPVGKD